MNKLMALDKETIRTMHAAGIGFVSHVRAPGGSINVWLEPDQVASFVEDREGFAAKIFEVTRQRYLDWVEADGAPRCSAVTKKGKRCSNSVRGGTQRTIKEWLELDGGYCPIHGGE